MVMPTRPVSALSAPPARLPERAAAAVAEPLARYKAFKAEIVRKSDDLSGLANQLRTLRSLLTWAEKEYRRRQMAIKTLSVSGYNESCLKEAIINDGLTLVEANILVWVASSPKLYQQELKEIADALYEIEGGERDDTESPNDVPKTSTGEAW